MTSGQKIAFSLLAALGLFAVFVMSLHSTLFKELETRFYAQSKIEENTGQLDKISESCDSYISEILSLVEKGDNAWTKNASVRSYYVQNPSESDVSQRRRLTENLFAQLPALSGIRIIDKNGRNVHYSSFDDTDILKQTGISKTYKYYPDIVKDASELSFELLQKNSSETKSVILCDEEGGRLVLSVPFCWVDGIYSGMALFYLNLHEVERELTSREVISLGQSLTLFSDENLNGGFVLNLPHGSKSDFRKPLLNYWKARSQVLSQSQNQSQKQLSGQQPEKLLSMPDGRYYLSLSSDRIGKIRISAVYTSDIFELSKEIRLLIYICVFISILLIVFLIFSFFRDPLVTLQKRIKKLQLGIIENYLDGKEKREWADVARHLRQRRDDLSDEIIKSLHVHSKKRQQEISEYLDKNWNEIFAIFENKAEAASAPTAGNAVSGPAELTGASIAEIRRMLEEVLQNRNLLVPVAGAAAVSAGAGAGLSKAVKAKKAPVEEVEEVEDLDEAGELDEVEEVEDLDDAEELDEVEEVEDLDDAEELDEVEEVEDLDEAEELDEVEEVEDLDDAEELDEAEEVEDLDDAEEVESLDEAEEAAEEVESLDEAEEVVAENTDAAESSDEVENLDDVEEVENLDDAEEVRDEEAESSEEDSDDDLDVLEEYVESEAYHDEVEDFIKALVPPQKEYEPSNETFFASEKFADVDNLFAEELKLGDFRAFFKAGSSPVSVTLYSHPAFEQETSSVPVKNLTEAEPLNENEPDFIDASGIADEPMGSEAPAAENEVEELTEEVPSYLSEPDFSMTAFGENLTQDMPELESALTIPKGPADAIVENDGVFSISKNLEYTDVVQDKAFKELVDSILS